MTNDTETIGTSLIEFGQSGEYHSESMTSAKQAAGFAPLETLPAEWYNNYMALLDQHINKLQNVVLQIQSELVNVLNWDDQASPSATQLNQVLNGIVRKINDLRPEIATGSEPGLVVSSAGDENVSVDSNGVMTYNGHAALVSDISSKLDELETEIQDAIDTLEDTISTRAHVIALNVTDNGSTSTALILKAESRVDGGSLDSYEPKAGDMIVLVCPTAVKELEDRVSLTLSIGDSQLTYTDSDGIQLGDSNVFTVVTFASASGTMVMTSGSGGGLKPLRYMKHILNEGDQDDDTEYGGAIITLSGYTPCVGDVVQIVYQISPTEMLKAEFVYGKDGWLTREAQYIHLTMSQTDVAAKANLVWVIPHMSDWVAYPMSDSKFYLGICTHAYEGLETSFYDVAVSIYSSRDVSSVTCTRVGKDGITEADLPASAKHMYCSYSYIYKVGTACRLNSVLTSITNLCYADAAGNLHAHTLELT